MKSRAFSPGSLWLARVLALAAVCAATGAVGGMLAIPPEAAPAIWPPAGIALMGLLLLGYRAWPGVWLGTFLAHAANLLAGSPSEPLLLSLAVGAGLGLGETLQAVAGAWLVRRLLGKTPTLDSLKEVLVLMILAGLVNTSVSATTTATLTAIFAGAPFWTAWWVGWRAAVLGVLVFAPLFLIVANSRRAAPAALSPFQVVEAATLFGGGPTCAVLLMGEDGTIVGAVLVVLSLLWATLRFGKVGTALAMLIIALLLVWNGKRGDAFLGAIFVSEGRRSLVAQAILGVLGGLFWILTAIQDDRQRAMRELRDNEARYRNLVELSPDAILILEDGCISYCNPAGLALLGAASLEVVLGKPIHEFLPPEEHAASAARIRTALETGRPVPPRPFHVRRLNGESIHVESRGGPCLYQGKPAIQVVARDITERKQAEERLKESEDRFARFMQHLPGLAWIKDLQGRYVYANGAAETVFRTPWAKLHGRTDDEIFPPEVAAQFKEHDRRALLSETGVQVIETLEHEDGILHHSLVSKFPIPGPDGRAALVGGMAIDITERNQAEESLRASEARLRAVLETAPDFILNLNRQGKVLFINRTLPQFTVDGVIGTSGFDYVPPDFQDRVRAAIEYVFQTGKLDQYETLGPANPDGSRSWYLTRVGPVLHGREVVAVTMCATDITVQKQAEEQLQVSLKEKEALLKEIHHRVKNNLQIISSLLNLQSLQLEDSAALAVFTDSQNRVRAMALVHETLYRSANLGHLDVAGYLDSLCASLFRAYGVESSRIQLDLGVADLPLDLDRAIPCGLLVNELVSNALKYAFPGNRLGRVAVKLDRCQDGTYALAVGDDGVGLPADLDFRHAQTLGLQLVCGLTQQLDGTIHLDRAGGTRFTITFRLGPQETGGSQA